MERSHLIEDLRCKAKDGATASRLIKDILAGTGGALAHADILELLMEAFHLPVVRAGGGMISGEPGLEHEALNRTLLADIVQNRREWDVGASTPGTCCWMDGLRLSDAEDARQQATAAPYPGISQETWTLLKPAEREALVLQLVSGSITSERLQMISRLAERLQQKIDELENVASSEACG